MENNENFVEQTENVEQTTEETVVEPAKLFTQDDLNAAVGKAKARERAKIEKQYQRKYGDLTDVLRAGMGKDDVGEITEDLREFYGKKKGIQIPQKPNYSAQDIEVLANADAAEIIRGGFDEVVEEADRLKALGVANMTARDKALFVALTNHIKDTETSRELSRIGVTEDVYNSKEFQDYRAMFRPDIPISKIYESYSKTQQPKKEHKTMGSMKSNVPDTGLKDFYSFEEASKFTKKDFDKNPALYKRVLDSMTKW